MCPPPGKYYPMLGSILPVGDITTSVPPELADVAILEEPEHVRGGLGGLGLGLGAVEGGGEATPFGRHPSCVDAPPRPTPFPRARS